jgi:hypothetical protein
MTRILFVFARLNPKVEYVQGMNEILAPIFYVVNHGRGRVQEAACFYMFNALMTDILELHMRDFAKQENGVHERMRHISTMLLVKQMAYRLKDQQHGNAYTRCASTPSTMPSDGSHYFSARSFNYSRHCDSGKA